MQYLERKKKGVLTMKKIWNVTVSVLALMAGVSHAQVPYSDSIYNYNNSPYNFDNSPYNYQNSPYNYENSQYNVYSQNAIYNERGQRSGYKTESPTGVVNYYDNNGNRKGYSTK